MNRRILIPNAIFFFLFSLVTLVSSFVLYIYWYIEISNGLEETVRKFHIDPHQVVDSQTVLVIVVLSVLAGLLLTGISMTFVYHQKMQQLYRLQNNFISNFTHELKTPVTSLTLYLETFLKHPLSNEERLRYTRFMLQDVSRLSDNISNILDLGRLESGRFKGSFVSEHVSDFMDAFFQHNRHLFPTLEIQVKQPEHKPEKVLLCIHLFEMLLINLATNALKYNDSEAPRLVIECVPERRHLQVRFRDNGPGIPATEQKKVFRKFYQGHRSETSSQQGSGLGLYLVHHIVKLHHGRIQIQPDSPGCTLALWLPYA